MNARHDIIATEQLITNRYSSFLNDFEKILPFFKKDYYSKNGVAIFLDMRNAVSNSVVLKLPKSDTYQALFYMLQFGLNHFKLSSSLREREIQVGDAVVKATGKVTRDYIDFGTWMDVFYAAVILRDNNAIDFMINLENRFMMQGNVSYDDVRVAEVEVYKALFYDAKFLKQAIEIYDQMEREFPKKDPSRGWIDYQGTPVITLCKAIVDNNTSMFNDELEKALTKHKKYFNTKSRATAHWGWISFPLLMICSYAFDEGIPIMVESDYIPKWLVEGDFKECELTIK